MERIIIVGSGVVGSATGKGFATHGHNVTFVDIDPARIESLRNEGYAATDEIDLTGPPAWVFLVLPTPNDGNRYDMTAFRRGVESVGEALRGASSIHTVVVRSTVPPGTCAQIVKPELERLSGRRCGEGFSLASNPEFLRAACALEDFLRPWMTVVASESKRTLELLRALYEPFGGDLRSFPDSTTAELVKCAHNLFNASKISFWNEILLVAERLGVDLRDVAETVANSAEGSFSPAYGIRAGQPYGGACLPKDTRGFLGFAEELGVDMPVLRATVRVNELMGETGALPASGSTAASTNGHRDEVDLREAEDLVSLRS